MLLNSESAPALKGVCYTGSFESTPEAKNVVLNEILGFMADKKLLTEDDMFWCRLVLDEALVNAFKHGNNNDPAKKVAVQLAESPSTWQVLIQDEGSGFDDSSLPSLDDEDTLTWNHGRGVNLMLHYMDGVEYYNNGSVLLLTKKKES